MSNKSKIYLTSAVLSLIVLGLVIGGFYLYDLQTKGTTEKCEQVIFRSNGNYGESGSWVASVVPTATGEFSDQLIGLDYGNVIVNQIGTCDSNYVHKITNTKEGFGVYYVGGGFPQISICKQIDNSFIAWAYFKPSTIAEISQQSIEQYKNSEVCK